MAEESLLGELLKTFKAQLEEEKKSRADERSAMEKQMIAQRKAMEAQMDAQRKAMEGQMKAQLDLIKTLQDNMNTSNISVASTSNASPVTVDKSQLIATLSGRIEKFSYEPRSDYTFSKWYDRYGSIITVDGAGLEDAAKVRLLLERLEERDYERYVDHIRPDTYSKFSLDETVKVLREMFDSSKSPFTSRFECLQIRKMATESHLDYTGRVNRMCEAAQLSTMTQDDWKSLLWLAGLDSHEDYFRPRLLAHLDAAKKNNTSVTIQSLYGEWNKMASFKRDAQMIEQGVSQVNVIKKSPSNAKKTFNMSDTAKSTEAPTCYNCGRNNHSSKECRCDKVQCKKCHQLGHLTRFCEDVYKYKQKFAKKTAHSSAVNKVTVQISNAIANVNATRKYIKVRVNDQDVHFQLDTGSDITLLNVDDWQKLGKPVLRKAGISIKNTSGEEIEVLGKIKCDFVLRGTQGKGDAYVTKFANLLGLEWIEQCPEMMYHLEQLTTVTKAENPSANDKVAQILESLQIEASEIKSELEKDRTLMQVKSMIQREKWPKGKMRKGLLKPYFQRCERLSVANDLLLDFNRVVIPETLRMKVLGELHANHPSFKRMKQLARGSIYWPTLDDDIKQFIKNCTACKRSMKTMAESPLSPLPKPQGPWQTVHVDFAGPVLGEYFMIVVDEFSRWPEIEIMSRISAVNTVAVLADIFSKHGCPGVIVTNNGTQFTSAEFHDMCKMNGIKHIRTAPVHPQSNGQAERFVDTLKRGMKKLKGEGVATAEEVRQLLLSYRSTPCTAIEGKSPAELFLDRKLRTRLSLIRPKEVPTELSENALSMKKQFDTEHGAKGRRFHKGDKVLVKRTWKNHWTWEHGTVIRPRGSVNYEVQTTRDRRTATYHANQMKSITQEDGQNQSTSSRWLEMMFDIFELPSTTLLQAPSAAVPVTLTSSSPSSPVAPAAAPVVQRRGRGRCHGPAAQSVPSPPVLRRSARTRKPVVVFDPSPQ